MKETHLKGKKTWLIRWNIRKAIAQKTLLAIAVLFIILLLWVVVVYGSNSFDQNIIDFIAPHITAERTRLMKFISFMANHIFLMPASFLLTAYFLFRKKRWMAIRTITVMLSSLLLMSLLKRLVQRQRPPDPLVEGITNFSFPSGHAFMSVAFYGLLIWFASVYISRSWLRRMVIFFLIFIITAIGFSRIYLRVHYATDVIAGICMGIVWLYSCLWIILKKETPVTRTN